MICSECATLRPMATAAGRKLLVGHVSSQIDEGDVVVLIRGDGDAYQLLQVATDSNDRNDPATLAAFLAPDEVDHSELTHALALADELSRPNRKAAKRKRARASQ